MMGPLAITTSLLLSAAGLGEIHVCLHVKESYHIWNRICVQSVLREVYDEHSLHKTLYFQVNYAKSIILYQGINI